MNRKVLSLLLALLCLAGMLTGCGSSKAEPEPTAAPTAEPTPEPTATPEPTPEPKKPMDTADLAEYVQERTVTVNVETLAGGKGTGSGFFIDDKGTIVTNFHVIDLAESISVEVSSGASYPVKEIVDFSNVYDLAILKIDVKDQPYLELAEKDARTGEQGTYTVSSANPSGANRLTESPPLTDTPKYARSFRSSVLPHQTTRYPSAGITVPAGRRYLI